MIRYSVFRKLVALRLEFLNLISMFSCVVSTLLSQVLFPKDATQGSQGNDAATDSILDSRYILSFILQSKQKREM